MSIYNPLTIKVITGRKKVLAGFIIEPDKLDLPFLFKNHPTAKRVEILADSTSFSIAREQIVIPPMTKAEYEAEIDKLVPLAERKATRKAKGDEEAFSAAFHYAMNELAAKAGLRANFNRS